MTTTGEKLQHRAACGDLLLCPLQISVCVHTGSYSAINDAHTIISSGGIEEACSESTSGATFALHVRQLRIATDSSAFPKAIAIGTGHSKENIAWIDISDSVYHDSPNKDIPNVYITDLSDKNIIAGPAEIIAVRFLFDTPGGIYASLKTDLYARDSDVIGALGFWAETWNKARRVKALNKTSNKKDL